MELGSQLSCHTSKGPGMHSSQIQHFSPPTTCVCLCHSSPSSSRDGRKTAFLFASFKNTYKLAVSDTLGLCEGTATWATHEAVITTTWRLAVTHTEIYRACLCTHVKVGRSHVYNDKPTKLCGLRQHNPTILVSFCQSCLSQATEQRGRWSSAHWCLHPFCGWSSGDILTWLGELLILGNAEVVRLPRQLLDEVGGKHPSLSIQNTFPPSFFHLHRYKQTNRKAGVRLDAMLPSFLSQWCGAKCRAPTGGTKGPIAYTLMGNQKAGLIEPWDSDSGREP